MPRDTIGDDGPLGYQTTKIGPNFVPALNRPL